MNSCYPARTYGINANRLFSLADALLGERGKAVPQPWHPPVDAVETDGHYEIIAELPGVNSTEVKVVVRDGVLTLSGERPVTSAAEGVKTHLSERQTGAFQRRFTLPKDADGERVSAAFKNGLMTVSVPKREEVKPKEIEIQIA
jgi:HSP20 family protein